MNTKALLHPVIFKNIKGALRPRCLRTSVLEKSYSLSRREWGLESSQKSRGEGFERGKAEKDL